MTNSSANQAVIQYTYAGARAPTVRLSNAAPLERADGALSIRVIPACPNFEPCGLVTLLVHVKNDLRHAIRDVRIADALRETPQLTYLPASAMLFLNGERAQISVRTPLGFDLAQPLAPGDNALILFNASICGDCEAAPLLIKVSAALLAIDEVTGRALTCADSALITRAKSANLSVFKRVEEGAIVFLLSNTGSAQAEAIRLIDALPKDFTVREVNLCQGGETRTLGEGDYQVDSAHRLTVPAPASSALSVPPASDAGPGEATITVVRA
ncbi:MAG: hypothetical protein RSA12_04325 [Clostridia bacterium]